MGQELAARLQLSFKDLDQQIEAQAGESISEIIFNRGEIYFRQLEREILSELLQQDQFVLALGGGTPCYFNNMDLINANSISIYLERSVGDLLTTLKVNRRERPLIAHLDGDNLHEFIAKHLFERREFYEQAIFKIPQKQRDPQERLNSIMQFLK